MQTALADFVVRIFELLLSPLGAGFFLLPLLTMRWILRFLSWVFSIGRGSPDLAELGEQEVRLRGQVDRLPQRTRDTFRRRY